MEREGRIEVIFGPMFSGKSSEMMRKVRRFQHAKKSCFVINYLHDNRYAQDGSMSTHDQITMKAVKTDHLHSVWATAIEHDVVAIDEGQFFPDICQFSENLANRGLIVIVAALDGTFQRKPFGNIMSLIPLAEKVKKLSAVCMYCTKEAAFTQRTVDSQEIQLIGGAETYKPVCRKCFHMKSNGTSVVENKYTETISSKPEIGCEEYSPQLSCE